MKLKIGPASKMTVTCEGMNKKQLVKDLTEALEFVSGGLDVQTPKKKKRAVRKKKAPVNLEMAARKVPLTEGTIV